MSSCIHSRLTNYHSAFMLYCMVTMQGLVTFLYVLSADVIMNLITYIPVSGISASLPTEINPCPKNKTEWIQRSSIHCSQQNDVFYHCLPTIFLNRSIEVCLRPTTIQQGFCAFYKNGSISFDHKSSCSGEPNCPKTTYRSNETYRYSLCQEINTSQLCYLFQADCQISDDPTDPTVSRNFTTTPRGGGISDASSLSPLVLTVYGLVFLSF